MSKSRKRSENHEGHAHGVAHGTRLLGALALTLGFALVELVAGWRSGSLALLADAGHMVTDGASLGLAAFAAWLVSRGPSERHSFGWGRIELLAALANALAMLAVIGFIGFEALRRFRDPHVIQGGTVSVVAGIGLVVNLVVAWMLAGGTKNLNVRAAMVHVLGDLLGSVAALVAGLVILFTQWSLIDPILSLLIGGIVLSSSLGVLRESLHGILDGVPQGISLPHLAEDLSSVEGVTGIADLHVWSLSSERSALSAHVFLENMEAWNGVLHRLEHVAESYEIEHTTFQPRLGESPLRDRPFPSYLCSPGKHSHHA